MELAVRGGEADRAPPRRIHLADTGEQPSPGALERVEGRAAPLAGVGAGRAGRDRGVRPRRGAADGAAARRPEPPSPAGRDGGGGRRTGERRPRGTSCPRVAGQRPGRPPDSPRPCPPAPRARPTPRPAPRAPPCPPRR